MTESTTRLNTLNPRYERWRIQVFLVTWLAYFGFYLTRKSFAFAKLSLGEQPWNWTKRDMAWTDGAYLTSYAVGQFAFGVLGDRFGTRAVVLTGMLASILMAIVSGFYSQVGVMMFLIGLQGVCQSTGWAPLAKNVGQFFSHRERGRVMGLWMTNYAAGGFAASALAGWAVSMGNWSWAFWVPALALVPIWIMFVVFQANQPEDVGLPSVEDYHQEDTPLAIHGESGLRERAGTWQVVQAVLRNRMVWLLALAYFLLKPTRYLLMFWAPTYLHERLKTSAGESGVLSGLFDLAGPISVISAGYLSDRVFQCRRMPICILALLGSACLVLLLHGLPLNRYLVGSLLFLLGFLLFIPDSLISGTAAIEFGTKAGASTAAGIINGCGSVGAIVGGTLPGWYESLFGPGSENWGNIFAILATSLFLAAIILMPKWNALPYAAELAGGKG